jgi:hypothetical protein
MNNINIKKGFVKKKFGGQEKIGRLRKIGFNRESIHREQTAPPKILEMRSSAK